MNKQDAEAKIFALRKRLDMYAQAGDVAEMARLQIEISEIQQKSGATKGAERKPNARTC
jgi:hypothetical protein